MSITWHPVEVELQSTQSINSKHRLWGQASVLHLRYTECQVLTRCSQPIAVSHTFHFALHQFASLLRIYHLYTVANSEHDLFNILYFLVLSIKPSIRKTVYSYEYLLCVFLSSSQANKDRHNQIKKAT